MKKKIAFVSTDWNDNEYRKVNNQYGGVSYYRLVKPMELLKDEYDVTFFGSNIQRVSKGLSTDQFYDKFTKQYDMIIVKQIDNATSAQALIHWANKNRCILVQDFDDNMLVVRDDQPASKMGYTKGGQRRAYAGAMMSLADALIVSTAPLKDYFGTFIKEMFGDDMDIYVFPNYNDVKDWKYKLSEKNPKKIVIGWAGSITHDADLGLVMPVLGKILDKYDNVHLELVGGVTQGALAFLTKTWSMKAKDKLKIKLGVPAWHKYPELIMQQKWDIAIAPLIDDDFNRGKSHIKWMEYSMAKLPVIASKVYPYFMPINGENIIVHGETGMLASTEEEWEQALETLITDKDKRITIGENAYKYVSENLQWKTHAETYKNIVSSIFDAYYKKKS